MMKLGETQRLAVLSALVALADKSYIIFWDQKICLFPRSCIFPMCHLEMHYIVGICAVASSVLGMAAVTQWRPVLLH